PAGDSSSPSDSTSSSSSSTSRVGASQAGPSGSSAGSHTHSHAPPHSHSFHLSSFHSHPPGHRRHLDSLSFASPLGSSDSGSLDLPAGGVAALFAVHDREREESDAALLHRLDAGLSSFHSPLSSLWDSFETAQATHVRREEERLIHTLLHS